MQAEAASPPRRRSPLVPAFAGLALSLPFWWMLRSHPDGAYDLLALFLALTGGIYFGAALHGGSRRRVVLEALAGGGMVILGALGLAWSPRWIALGFLLHGLWDLAHHTGTVKHGVRRWFPPFCAAWDWAVAALLFWYS